MMTEYDTIVYVNSAKPEYDLYFEDSWVDRMADAGVKCECSRVALNYYPNPVEAEITRVPRRKPISLPMPLAELFRRDFYEVVSTHLPPHVTGPCYLVQGRSRILIDEYITCYCLDTIGIAIRGGPGSQYSVCSVCGNARSKVRSINPKYVLRHHLGHNLAYQVRRAGAFLLCEKLMNEIDWSKFPAELTRYGIREEAIDDCILPGDPDWPPPDWPPSE